MSEQTVSGWHGHACVPGEAQGMGSKRALQKKGRIFLVDDNRSALRSWQHDLIRSMLETKPPQPVNVAAGVHLLIYVRRPQAHFGSGKNAGALKPTAPRYPPTGRDVDKIARAVGDAGTQAGWWVDDCRIAFWRIARRYADDGGERVEVEAWALE